jgi:hypothetical protein
MNILNAFFSRPKPPAEEQKAQQERIVASAVIKNGQLWAAPLHGWIIPDVCKYNQGSFVTADEQGFLMLTQDGLYRFIDRTEAHRIALAARQIVNPLAAKAGEPPQLTSQQLGWGHAR